MSTSTTTTAHVTFTRDEGGAWLVTDDDEPRVHTYGETLGEARANVREAVAVWRDVDPAGVELVERIEGQ